MPLTHTEGPTHAHGRKENRPLKVIVTRGSTFLEACQVVHIGRHRRRHGKKKGSREVGFALTHLDAHQVCPVESATHTRKHRTIENRVRYARDVTCKEDARRTRAGAVPVVLECLTYLVRQVLAAPGEESRIRTQSPHRSGKSSRTPWHYPRSGRMDLNRENSASLIGDQGEASDIYGHIL